MPHILRHVSKGRADGGFAESAESFDYVGCFAHKSNRRRMVRILWGIPQTLNDIDTFLSH